MADIEKALDRLGLSQNEIKVYLTLTDSGSLKAGRISKLAQMDRSSVYNALQMLLQKGLASYVFIKPFAKFEHAFS